MSGVYIKGLPMPTESTVLAIYKIGGKFFAGQSLCPIIPVPDHGRLIEADKLKVYMLNEHYRHEKVVSLSDIGDAPTIIPEDRAERNEK